MWSFSLIDIMKIPKFIRRYVYRKLLERAACYKIYLCDETPKIFPYLSIHRYPELYSRRALAGSHCLEPFDNHAERIKFLNEAVKLTYDRLPDKKSC